MRPCREWALLWLGIGSLLAAKGRRRAVPASLPPARVPEERRRRRRCEGAASVAWRGERLEQLRGWPEGGSERTSEGGFVVSARPPWACGVCTARRPPQTYWGGGRSAAARTRRERRSGFSGSLLGSPQTRRKQGLPPHLLQLQLRGGGDGERLTPYRRAVGRGGKIRVWRCGVVRGERESLP